MALTSASIGHQDARHFNGATLTAFNPHVTGMGFQWWDLTVIALWGLGALLLDIRFIRWIPRAIELFHGIGANL